MLDANVTKIALYTDGTSNYINAGNVGIGTTAPTTKLNVSGSIAVSSGSYLSFIDSNLNYNKIGRNTSVGGIQITTGGNATMNLLDNGNVGIGTTSPSSKLQVSGDAYVTGQFGQGVAIANKIATYGAEFRAPGASAQIFFGRSSSSVGSGAIGADSTYVFRVWTMPGFGNPFVIKQDGNVGIGTTAPSQKLHISGNMRLTGAFRDRLNSQGAANYVLTSTGSNGTQWVDASGSSIIGGPYLPLVGGTMSGNIVFNNNIAETWKDNAGATTRMMILNSANIAYIGPVDTYAGGPILYGTSADVTAQVFYTGASERMRIT